LGFFIDLVFPAALGPGVDSASNINEYQGYLLGGKGGQFIEMTTLLPSCADCFEILGALNSWSPNGLPDLYRDSFTFTIMEKTVIRLLS
jgi:hypothetical protein